MLFCVSIIKVAELVSIDESLKTLECCLEPVELLASFVLHRFLKMFFCFGVSPQNISLLPYNPTESTVCV